MTIGESHRATQVGDTIGTIEVVFSNAINYDSIIRTRPDLDAARRLVAHFQPYNNTRIDAWQVSRVDGGYTYSLPVDLRVDGRWMFCPNLGDETACPTCRSEW